MNLVISTARLGRESHFYTDAPSQTSMCGRAPHTGHDREFDGTLPSCPKCRYAYTMVIETLPPIVPAGKRRTPSGTTKTGLKKTKHKGRTPSASSSATSQRKRKTRSDVGLKRKRSLKGGQ